MHAVFPHLTPRNSAPNHNRERDFHGYSNGRRQPTVTEKSGETNPIMPQEARLRNMTYAAPLYADVTVTEYSKDIDAPDDERRTEQDQQYAKE